MADKINDGGPAFPLDQLGIADYASVEGKADDATYMAARARAARGMTLRDYFAAKAMPQVARNIRENVIPDGEDFSFGDDIDCKMIAEQSYQMADAMLAMRGGK